MYQSVQTNGTSRPIKLINPFQSLPWQVQPWRDQSSVLLLTGASGGGKSRLAAEKLHAYCLKYPGATALIARKVKTSMAAGTILFMRRKIVGPDPAVRWVDSPKNRFEYKNGSILQFIGLLDDDARENLKSIGQDGAVDIAWLEEATQFDEEDMNAMSARMRGHAAHWRQIILTCNPDAPTHWIKRRLIDGGEAQVYYSKAADNYHNPADYQNWLATLTGIDHQRLVLGQWVQASGLVYDVWSEQETLIPYLDDEGYEIGPDRIVMGNVTTDAEYIPDGGPVYWAVDDGYTGQRDEKTGYFTADSHPRVFLPIQERPNGQLCVFYEDYRIKTEADPHIADMFCLPMLLSDVRERFRISEEIKGVELITAIREVRYETALRYEKYREPDPFYPEPDYVAIDSAAATLSGMMNNRGFYLRKKPSNVEESIKNLRRMLAPDANGFRRIIVHPRCRHLRAEMASYRYDQQTEKPVKEYDHGPDALRYFAWTKRLED